MARRRCAAGLNSSRFLLPAAARHGSPCAAPTQRESSARHQKALASESRAFRHQSLRRRRQSRYFRKRGSRERTAQGAPSRIREDARRSGSMCTVDVTDTRAICARNDACGARGCAGASPRMSRCSSVKPRRMNYTNTRAKELCAPSQLRSNAPDGNLLVGKRKTSKA
jgi:hypothetical protein